MANTSHCDSNNLYHFFNCKQCEYWQLFLAVAPAVFVSSCAILAFRDNYEEAMFFSEIEKTSYLPSLYKWKPEQDT